MMNYCFRKSNEDLSEQGSILIYSILVLASILTISIALLNLFIPKFRIARESVNSIVAVFAADSALEWCIFSNRDDPLTQPAVPSQPAISIVGVSYQIYRDSSVTTCPSGETLNYRAVGNYRGISRSLEIYE